MARAWHRAAAAAVLLGLAVSGAAAAEEPVRIGSREAGMARLEKTKTFIAEHGIDKAIDRIQNDKPPFKAPYPAIAIIEYRDGRHYIGAHTTYPSIQGLDFTEQQDLVQRKFIQNFFDRVQQGGGTAPTTNAVPPENRRHLSQCYSEWIPDYKGEYWIVACYDHPSILDAESAS